MDDEKARKARAKRFRKQIKNLVSPKSKTEADPDNADVAEREKKTSDHENPREFIHRRMRELDNDEAG